MTANPGKLPKAMAFGAALFVIAAARPSLADPSSGSGPGIYGESKGTAAADETTGAFTYTLPFDLPEARGKVQPSLGLHYSSAARDGEAGYGWGLGLPTIERRSLSGWAAFAPNPNGSPGAEPSGEERYSFNGQPLVKLCDHATTGCAGTNDDPHPGWATDWVYYRIQNAALAGRFYRSQDRTAWRVQLPGGERLDFGGANAAGGAPDVLPASCNAVDHEMSADGQQENPGILRWHPTHRFDVGHPVASVVAYCWRKLGSRGLSYLTDIWDTPRLTDPSSVGSFAHHTQLDWETPPFAQTRYANLDRGQPDQQVRHIMVSSATWAATGERKISRRYDLEYNAGRARLDVYNAATDTPFWHHSFLHQVTEKGDCGEEAGGIASSSNVCAGARAPMTFEYSGSSISVGGLPSPITNVPAGQTPMQWLESVSLVDFNQDGLPDVVQSWQTSDCSCGEVNNLTPVVSTAGGSGGILTCGNDPADCPMRSARPIVGYLNRGSSFDFQCMDSGAYVGGPAAANIIEQNAGHRPGFLAGSAVNLLGMYGEGQLLWQLIGNTDKPYRPILARPILRSLAEGTAPPANFQSGGCDLGGSFDSATFYPKWRWEFAPDAWAKPADGITNPEQNPEYEHSYVDVDGDGFPDMLGTGGTEVEPDLRRTNVAYTRVYSKFEHPTGTAQLVPFSASFSPEVTLAPKAQPRDMHFFYVDMNGDGLVDLVTQHSSQNGGAPRVYPGNGRSIFGCGLGKQPWACMTNVTTDPQLQPYVTSFSTPVPFSDDVFLHDVTGDGLADLVAFDPGVATTNVRLWVNRDGYTFDCIGANADCVVGGILSTALTPHRTTFADMNGDGVDDLVVMTNSEILVGSFYNATLTPASARGSKPGQLIRIGNGVGATTEVRYESVQDLDLQAASDPQRAWKTHSPVAQSVVTQIRTRDTQATLGVVQPAPYAFERKTRFYYRDPRFDRWKRELVGFEKIAVQDGDQLAVTETTRHFDDCENATIAAESQVTGLDENGAYKTLVTDSGYPRCICQRSLRSAGIWT